MPRTLRRLRDDDGGWALVTALVLMTIMIGMGLALSVVLRGQGEVSATQRAARDRASTSPRPRSTPRSAPSATAG